MKRLLKQISAGFLAIALVFSAIPPIQANAAEAAPTVTGITFEDMEFIEGNEGYYRGGEEGEDEWYYYDLYNYNYSIQLSDGTSLTREELNETYDSDEYYASNGYFYFDGVYYDIVYSSTQSAETPWAAGGTYDAIGEVYMYDEAMEESELKFQDTFSCSVIELPLAEIIFEPLEILEGTNGYWADTEGGEYYYYYPENYNFTVKFSDGTDDYVSTYEEEEEQATGFYYSDQFVYIDFNTDQSFANQWKPGQSYKVTAKVGDYETEFDATIAALPIKEIVIEPKETLEYTNGYWDYDWIYSEEDEEEYQTDEYYRYDEYSTWNYTVKFSDGTPDIVHNDFDDRRGFYYNDHYVNISFSTDQSYQNQWKAGNTYKVDVTAGPFKTTYDFKIIKTPVQSVEVKPVKLFQNSGGYFDYIWDYVDGEDVKLEWYYYNVNREALSYKVTLKDGTVLTPDSAGDIKYNDEWYYPQVRTDQEYENQWGVGEHEAVITVLGYEQPFKVTILCDEHVWDKGTTTEPTCTAKGEVTYKCTNEGCQETKTALTDAKGHKAGAAATCKAPQTCTDCGAILAEKTGHKAGAAATCKAPQTCTDCGAILAVKTEHTPGAAATCTEPQTCTVCQTILAVPTGHTAGPDATCTTAQTCAACGVELEQVKGHAVALVTKAKATADDAGEIVETCICGQVMSTTAIAKVSTVKIAKTKYAYAGKAIEPAVTVKDSAGKALAAGTDYNVTYKNSNKVGKAAVTVKFIGNYSGSRQLTYTINPAKPTIKKPVAAQKALTAKWSKVSKQATGYEIMVATDKKFTKNKKTVTVKSYKKTSKKISKLKAKKTYYVKVRTYKTVGKTKYYSDWSAVKSIKTR